MIIDRQQSELDECNAPITYPSVIFQSDMITIKP